MISVRESRDSEVHPDSTPIIIGLDVTGSMNSILEAVAKKLGTMVEEILNRKPVSDPQIMFNAIGDAMYDDAPLQVTQFETDIKIAEQLTDLWFERGGGGNNFESYPLTWYFASRHTDIDSFNKRNKKGFIFTIGDDGYPEKLTREEIKKFIGDDIQGDINTEELLAEVNRKYEVFHLYLDGRSYWARQDKERWKNLMGQNVINVTDYTKIPEIIVSILERYAGKSIDEVADSWDGSTGLVVREALSGLSVDRKENGLVTFD